MKLLKLNILICFRLKFFWTLRMIVLGNKKNTSDSNILTWERSIIKNQYLKFLRVVLILKLNKTLLAIN